MKGALPTWGELARMPDDELDVALVAALVARDTYDDLDVPALLEELDALGARLEPDAGVTDDRDRRERVMAVSERFVALGFRGNTDDYFDPKNSLLPDVLARKTGIPITLSIVWCAIARSRTTCCRPIRCVARAICARRSRRAFASWASCRAA